VKKKNIQYDPRHDLYKRLGVPPNASAETIQQSYRKLAKTLHPDLNPERREWATQEFQTVNEAYDVLSDRELRLQYDKSRYLATGVRSGPQDNWWDVPHPVDPEYAQARAQVQRQKPRPVPPPPPRANGQWLERWGLGLFKPLFLALSEILYSPYRPILILLMLVLVANFIFLILTMTTPDEGNRRLVLPPQISPITAAPLASSTPIPTSSQFYPSPCPEPYQLRIVGLERPFDQIKLTTLSSTPNLRSQDVIWQQVRLNEDGSLTPLGPLEALDLLVVTSPPSQESPLSQLALAANVPIGWYLLGWQPIPPDGSLVARCDQLINLQDAP
jgi:hypothetical protein